VLRARDKVREKANVVEGTGAASASGSLWRRTGAADPPPNIGLPTTQQSSNSTSNTSLAVFSTHGSAVSR
jgi:hypothetical protein